MAKHELVFTIGERTIDSVDVKVPYYKDFVDYFTAAVNTPKTTFEAALRRVRMLRQVTYYSGSQVITFDQTELLRMPLPAARKLFKLLEANDESPAGKIIRDGDGISTAIAYELGTPIEVAGGKEPIKELEFLAQTYGDVEDVVAISNVAQATLNLLRTVAKPVHSSLLTMPSWAVDRITFSDGIAISQDVTSRFRGDGEEDN